MRYRCERGHTVERDVDIPTGYWCSRCYCGGVVSSPPLYGMEVAWSDEDSCYVSRVPELQGCVAHGLTEQAALESLADAMDAWLASAREHGDPIPREWT